MVSLLSSIRRLLGPYKAKIIAKKHPVYRGLSNDFDRLYHVHIRKCAGSSFNLAFTQTADALHDLAVKPDHRMIIGGKPIVGWTKSLLERGCYWYGFSHIAFHELKLPPRTFTFTFFRDPAERLLSHYNMLHDMAADTPDHIAFTNEGAWMGSSFSDFLTRIPREHLENQLYMFDPGFNIERALDRLATVNHVGVIETIESDFLPMLKERFGISLNYEHVRKTRFKYRPTGEETALLRDKLIHEYKFLDAARERGILASPA